MIYKRILHHLAQQKDYKALAVYISIKREKMGRILRKLFLETYFALALAIAIYIGYNQAYYSLMLGDTTFFALVAMIFGILFFTWNHLTDWFARKDAFEKK